MSPSVRSKKMALSEPSRPTASATGHIERKMVRINRMADHIFRPDRRALLAGLGARSSSGGSRATAAQDRPALPLRAKADVLALRPGEPDTPIWSLDGPDLRFRRGDSPEIAFGNDLPAPMVLDWRGIDGALAAEPLLARASLARAPGKPSSCRCAMPAPFCATSGCSAMARRGQPAALPLVVAESEPVAVDRDEVVPDRGLAASPGWNRRSRRAPTPRTR